MTISFDVGGRETTIVSLHMTKDAAEELSHSLSDILCWASGFEAARAGTDLAHHGGPMGLREARELNIQLKRALGVADDHTPF